MKRVTAILLALALLFGTLPLLPRPAAAEGPLFTLTGIGEGYPAALAEAGAPEGAPYTIEIEQLRNVQLDYEMGENATFLSDMRYGIFLRATPTTEDGIAAFTDDAINETIADMAGVQYAGERYDYNGTLGFYLYYEPVVKENVAGKLLLADADAFRPVAGQKLLTSKEMLEKISVEDPSHLGGVRANWLDKETGNQIDDEVVQKGYIVKPGQELQLYIYLYWKDGYNYGFMAEDMNDEALRKAFNDDATIKGTDFLNTPYGKMKNSAITITYQVPASGKTPSADGPDAAKAATLTLQGSGLTAVPASGHKAGDAITLVLSAPAGKTLAKLEVNGKDVSADVKDNQYSFTLVETNSAAVTWRDVAAAAAGLDLLGENVSASPAKAGSYADGEEVTITLTPPEGKELDTLTVGGKDHKGAVQNNKLTILFAKGAQVAVTWKDKAPSPAAPAKPATTTVLTIGSNVLIRTVNGVTTTSMMDVAPYINPGQNRTMLPLRAVGEILGLKVEWSDATRTVSVTGEGVNATVPVDGKVIVVNGKTITVDASAEIKNGRTMMSIANLGTALGLERDKNIIWDDATRTVTINV